MVSETCCGGFLMDVKLLWSSAITVCAAILVPLEVWARDVSGAVQTPIISATETWMAQTGAESPQQTEADQLFDEAVQHWQRGEYPIAIEKWEAALTLYRQVGNWLGEARALNGLGGVYWSLGEYGRAIDFLEQSLTIAQEIGDRAGEGMALGNLGIVYYSLGEYGRAIDFFEQRLAIAREIGDPPEERLRQNAGEGMAMGNLGVVYWSLGEYGRAIDFFEQRLAIAREIGDRAGEGMALGNLGVVYLSLGHYGRAIDRFEQSLVIAWEIGDRAGEGNALLYLGAAHHSLGDYEQTINFYEQSLAIAREIGNREGESDALNNLGYLFADDEQPALAIVFYKQSVNVREGIRRDITDLTLLQSYTDTVADTYRRLADLLLEQGRILEAQQVLELLKVQELQEFTDDERVGGSQLEVVLLPKEAEIMAEYGTLVAFGQQLRDCEATRCPNLANLRDQRDDQFRQYQAAVDDLRGFIRDRLAAGDDPDLLLNPTRFEDEALAIIPQQPGTVVIYPLVLDDRLWLLWTPDGRVMSRREIPVSRLALGQQVVQFRSLLENRHSNLAELQAVSQQLYTWLIAPIEQELAAHQDIQHLVFSLDRTTRYLPMAALYDGEQYLIEKYTVATILSAGLTDVSRRAPVGTEGVSMLGAGVSQAFEGFSALTEVPRELNSILRDETDPNDTDGLYLGRRLLNADFTFNTLRDSLDGRHLLHIATHGAFVPGRRDQSYLLMGDGQRLPIPEIETLKTYMQDVHLVVLSACQTALGGPDEEGLEIAGLGYYFLKSQAAVVMASLWNVSDSSTSQLMQQFYTTLARGTATHPVTTAEALRQAQLDMLRGQLKSQSSSQADNLRFILVPRNGDDALSPSDSTHPYYWAPFILIGNSL